MKFDDQTINSYIDNELTELERVQFEAELKINTDLQREVSDLINLNLEIKNSYDHVLNQEIPSSITSLLEEKEGFLKKTLKYKIGIIPALSSMIIASVASIFSFNTIQLAFNDSGHQPIYVLEDTSKNLILNEIQKITGESQDSIFLSGIFDQQINFSIQSEFINNSGDQCMEVQFDQLKYKDLTINEAIICENNGSQKIIKLSFIKGNFQNI